jgi:hypothetical protein
MKNNKIFIMNRQQGKSTLAKLIAELNRKDSLLVFNNIAQLINYRNRKENVRTTIISELIKYKTSRIKYLIIDDYHFSEKSTEHINEFIQNNFELENIFIFCTLPEKYESISKGKLSDILTYFKLVDKDRTFRERNTIKGKNVEYGIFNALYDSFLTWGDTFEILDLRLNIEEKEGSPVVDKIISVIKADEYTLFNYPDIMPTVSNGDIYFDIQTKKEMYKQEVNSYLYSANTTIGLEKAVVEYIRDKSGKLIESSYNVTKNTLNIKYYGEFEKPRYTDGHFVQGTFFSKEK